MQGFQGVYIYICINIDFLGGGFKYVFMFTPKIGEIIQFDLRIFLKWVGEKTPTSFP